MTVILFILFVVAVVAIEILHRRNLGKAHEQAFAPIRVESVSGVGVSKDLSYHPCHTWARRIDAQTAAVGIDDFGNRFIGKVDHVVLPVPGARLHAGQSCVKIVGNGREIALTAPMSGEIVEVNSELMIDPEALHRDPYGDGWLYQVRDWRLIDQLAALISGDRAVGWMRSCVERLVGAEPRLAGAVSQDGGLLCDDLSIHMDKHEWIHIVREHLGTDPRVDD